MNEKKRFRILKRDNFTCQYCGRKPPEVKLEIDHILPKSKNGGDDDSNLTTSCRQCNIGKSNLYYDDKNVVEVAIKKILNKKHKMVLLRYKQRHKRLIMLLVQNRKYLSITDFINEAIKEKLEKEFGSLEPSEKLKLEDWWE